MKKHEHNKKTNKKKMKKNRCSGFSLKSQKHSFSRGNGDSHDRVPSGREGEMLNSFPSMLVRLFCNDL